MTHSSLRARQFLTRFVRFTVVRFSPAPASLRLLHAYCQAKRIVVVIMAFYTRLSDYRRRLAERILLNYPVYQYIILDHCLLQAWPQASLIIFRHICVLVLETFGRRL